MFKKKIIWILFCVSILALGMTERVDAAEYSNKTTTKAEGFTQSSLFDKNRNTYTKCTEQGTITIENSQGIHAIYIEFDRLPKEWTLTNPDNGKTVTCGTYSFLHEFVDVKALFETIPTKLVMTFAADTTIADIYVFSDEEIPDFVQIWQPPCEEADLMLVTTHSDDEQLFFSGLLPLYAGEKDLKVQVVYGVQHFEANGVKNHQRPHEQLDGLWTVGVRNYPIMPEFPDLYAESKDRNVAFKNACRVYEAAGVTYDDFVSYATECLRRFKPLVVVSHDLNGEYGHGGHVLISSALTEAIEYAADETKYTESALEYGTWSVEKLYLHLYEENQIVMNYDEPLESFGGKTAFEVSQDGFGCHKSQHWTWFYRWMYGTSDKPVKKATDIQTYSPCYYGLYYTSVGADVVGGDFMENVKSYEVRHAEEQERLEQERLEQERLEQERLEAEKEEAEKIQKENSKRTALAVAGGLVIVIGGIAVVLLGKKRGKHE